MQLPAAEIARRFENHPPANDDVAARLDGVTTAMTAVAGRLAALLPDGREADLAIVKLEEVSMWAKAAIARSDDNKPGKPDTTPPDAGAPAAGVSAVDPVAGDPGEVT